MSDKLNGGPAFPHHWVNDSCENQLSPDGRLVCPGESVVMPGMTLRDYFAAKAMQGFCSGPDYGLARDRVLELSCEENTAKCAYEIADAMLEERKII